ncbi:uncharacterized protein LOC108911673 [Anoplophora glabripennis]|uniref:uncharacterized protein LOC108911673 n=1 Tax=Anoplophora glabripennis TaxID=217634 RepID=UPI00087391EC|nr:uncharacterized protein LOC108911673 [Anoplophora glabripennis]
MLAFSTIILLGVIAAANAGLITPHPLVRAYAVITPTPASIVLPQGSSLEGRYIPDHLETLYDDGSYKPQPTSLTLAASPYGLVPAGSGLEGQYIPDNLERLYDDGSYKPEAAPVPFSASPYGLVPAGSGLEGHYIPDLSEKLYDDGSYRPQYVVA